VRGGGHLVLGQRSAMKDDDNALQPECQPGPLTDLLGGRVEQYYALENPVPVEGKWETGQSLLGRKCSVRKKKMWRFSNVTAAATVGSTYSLPRSPGRLAKAASPTSAHWLDDEAMKSAARWMTEISGVKPELGPVPQGIEAYPRSGNGKKCFILVNFSRSEQTIRPPAQMEDLLNGGTKNSVDLPIYGVTVLKSTRWQNRQLASW
jgi:beta-galactosidase